MPKSLTVNKLLASKRLSHKVTDCFRNVFMLMWYLYSFLLSKLKYAYLYHIVGQGDPSENINRSVFKVRPEEIYTCTEMHTYFCMSLLQLHDYEILDSIGSHLRVIVNLILSTPTMYWGSPLHALPITVHRIAYVRCLRTCYPYEAHYHTEYLPNNIPNNVVRNIHSGGHRNACLQTSRGNNIQDSRFVYS